MDKTMTRIYHIDGDTCEVVFQYDAVFGKYFGDYPDFEETPKFTRDGKPWVTAMQESCTFAQIKAGNGKPCVDCGACVYFQREKQTDLIGVCQNDRNINRGERER